MQSTGQTSTHALSLTWMHGSAMTYGIVGVPSRPQRLSGMLGSDRHCERPTCSSEWEGARPRPFNKNTRGRPESDPSDLDGELPARVPDRIVAHAIPRWATQDGSGRHIEGGAVPGAGDDLALQLALGQRSPAVGARVVNRVEAPVHIKDREAFALDLHELGSPRWNVFDRSHPDEFAHPCPPVGSQALRGPPTHRRTPPRPFRIPRTTERQSIAYDQRRSIETSP